MDDVVATTLITGSVGVSGAWFTYRATKKQSEATLTAMERQAGVERERVQNERDRLKSELQAPRLQQRQSAYHAFLDACQTFHQDQPGTPSMTREQVAEWLTEFEHRLNAVSPFGTRDASSSAAAFTASPECAAVALQSGAYRCGFERFPSG